MYLYMYVSFVSLSHTPCPTTTAYQTFLSLYWSTLVHWTPCPVRMWIRSWSTVVWRSAVCVWTPVSRGWWRLYSLPAKHAVRETSVGACMYMYMYMYMYHALYVQYLYTNVYTCTISQVCILMCTYIYSAHVHAYTW